MVWDFDHPDPSAVPTADHNGRDVVLLSMTDALGQTTSYKYDALGNVISETVSSFPSANYAPVTQADGTGAVTSVTATYTYDPLFDRMTSETDGDGVTLYFVYDSPEETLPPGVSVAINDTNPTGNILATVDGMGFVTYFTYATGTTYDGTFGPGDLATITDPNGNVTEYLSYDAYGDPTSIKNAVGDMTTDNYTARGLLLHETATGGVDITKTYDALERPTSIIQADDLDHSPSESLVDTYYPGGQVKTQTTGVGQVTTYDYDSGNRLVTMTDLAVLQADGTQQDLTTYYTYDAAGNMVQERDPRHCYDVFLRWPGSPRRYDGHGRSGPEPQRDPRVAQDLRPCQQLTFRNRSARRHNDLHVRWVVSAGRDDVARTGHQWVQRGRKCGLRPGGQHTIRVRRQWQCHPLHLRQRLSRQDHDRSNGHRDHVYL